jgi:hypothetical protein
MRNFFNMEKQLYSYKNENGAGTKFRSEMQDK